MKQGMMAVAVLALSMFMATTAQAGRPGDDNDNDNGGNNQSQVNTSSGCSGSRGEALLMLRSGRRGDDYRGNRGDDNNGRRRIRVQFELNNAQPNRLWLVTIRQNGDRVFSDVKRTNNGGDLTVRLTLRNERGRDSIRATAERQFASCSVSASIG